MRKLRLALIFVVVVMLVLTAVSCKKKPTEPEEIETVVADETVVLDETESESIIEVTDDQIVLPAGTSPSVYQKGKVIVAGVSDAAPYGLLRKVESSSTQNGQIVVNTSQARLVDAFDQLDFHTTQSLKTTDIVSSEALTDGVRFVQDSKNPYNYHYIIDKEFNVGNNVTMYIDGELDLTLGYELAAKISWRKGLHYIKAGSFVTSDGDLELNVDGAFNYQQSIELIRHDFGSVVFVVPAPIPVPIVLVPKVIIMLNIDAYGEAHVTATVTTSASVEAGLEYQKPNWSSYCEKDLDFDYDIPVVDASMNATVDAGPRFEINLYGIAGPWAHARGFLSLDADINATPWWTLTGGYVVDAGVHFEVFDYGESATIPNIINHSVVLAQASQNQVATPTFNPPGGTYTSAQNVTISCATPGVTIYYSTDGSTPSIRYTKPVSISSTATLKAKATKAGWTDSQIASANYTINITPNTVATPTFSPPGGTYTSAQSVRITCATSGATIRYTTNGTEPTANSSTYSSPINVSSTTTIKAKGFKNGWTPSSTASAIYTINITPNTVATPTFNPPGGTYTSAQNVQISCATIGATIRYTTNGTDPTANSPTYSSPINVSSTTTIKAKGFKNGWTPSSTASATYTINAVPPPPASFVLVEGGTFHNGTSDVTISSFYIDKYELTQAEYQAVMGNNPSSFTGVTNGPVECVSWFKAIEYCNRRSMQEGLTPCYSYGSYGTNPDNWPSGWNTNRDNHTNVACSWTADGYRLPTEMEWMFAAKGGNQSQGYTYSGSNNIDAVAWYYNNSSNTTHTVGTKAPNELGIYDMSGNVLEWCWDIYGSYPSGAQSDPHGANSGSHRVKRGGSWNSDAGGCPVSRRGGYNATSTYYILGFRICRVFP